MASKFDIHLFKNFNNYFNRIIKGYNTYQEYNAASEASFTTENINFNPNDYVSTEVIINGPTELSDIFDYAIIEERFTAGGSRIHSRWFVMNTIRTRGSQYKFILRRDVIYDHIDKLLPAPIYVQKGWLQDGDPFIFNDEGMSFNQIKTSETLLKDITNSSWIIAYLAKNAAAEDIPVDSPSQEITDFVNLSTIAAQVGLTEAALAQLMNIDTDTNANAVKIVNHYELYHETHTVLNGIVLSVNWRATWFVPDFSEYTFLSVAYDENSAALFKLPPHDPKDAAFLNKFLNEEIVASRADVKSILTSIFTQPFMTEAQKSILLNYVGKTVKYNNNYYIFSIKLGSDGGSDTNWKKEFVYNQYQVFSDAVERAVARSVFEQSVIQPSGTLTLNSIGTLNYLHLTSINKVDQDNPASTPEIKSTISSNRVRTETESFDMVAIPVNYLNIVKGGTTFRNEEGLAKRIAIALEQKLGSSCYDVQLLPYCPLVDIAGSNQVDISNLTEDTDYNFIERKIYNQNSFSGVMSVAEGNIIQVSGPHADHDNEYLYRGTLMFAQAHWLDFISSSYTVTSGNAHISDITKRDENAGGIPSVIIEFYCSSEHIDSVEISVTISVNEYRPVGIMLYCKKSSFQAVLDYQLETAEEYLKVETLCDKYRLCSPNYQGSFDFDLAKNGGSVDYFIAECSYKPFTPYIKVAPSFNLLYGNNFGDARGLICGGDYSIPRFEDHWIQYELNNKNYQNIFNREIQNLEFNQSLERTIQTFSATAGAMGLSAGGAAAGASSGSAGGPYGAIIGAAVGGVAGLGLGTAGAIMDLTMLGRKQREERSLAIDKYNYQLGNIKALPYTLTKIGSFNINSKIWPFLEYYTCTDVEKEALIKKLRYESMTVMRIDKMENYYDLYEEKHFFKGELIWDLELGLDNNIFEAIYAELLKGVFI